MRRRHALGVAAVLAVPLAIALAVVAVDVLRLPGKLDTGDVRFEAAPARSGTPWSGIDFVRGWPAARFLEIEDDLAYRRTMKRFLRVQPGKQIFGPELENLRGRIQLELTAGSAADANPERRAQYLNLLAAYMLERVGSSPTENEIILRRAIHTLRSAVETDPENEDAKINLELALRNAKAVNVPGTDPDAGGAEGTLSGQGRSGTGY
ncbi:MAG TPA: hypothetical protein VMN35_04650 [Gaiellaceae bacterium]|nr:hypothetical protein [Gaiellaceae bacterium]